MKLRQIEQREGYRFRLVFENGEAWEAGLQELIGQQLIAAIDQTLAEA